MHGEKNYAFSVFYIGSPVMYERTWQETLFPWFVISPGILSSVQPLLSEDSRRKGKIGLLYASLRCRSAQLPPILVLIFLGEPLSAVQRNIYESTF